MKKSFLALMAVAMLGLSACTKPTPKPQPEPTPEVPTAEGKITFYFEMGQQEDAVAVPEWASIYLTGAFTTIGTSSTDWKTAANEVVTFQKLEGTNTWYGQYEVDHTLVTDCQYQLTLGYAVDSGAPSTGVNWGYKSVECKAASGDSGMDNLSFELSADGLTANLGSHHWDAAPGAVKLATNVDVQITLAEALPEYVALYAPGNYRNNWSCSATDDKMTPSEDRKTWSIHIDSITVGTYEMKIIAEYADCESFSWKTTVLDNGAGGNYALMVLTGDTDGTININEMESVEAYTVDLTNLPDPSTLTKLETTLNVAFEKMPEGFPETWWVCGSMNGRKGSDTHVFSWVENDFSMSITFEVNSDTEYEFGIVASSTWAPCIKSAEGENLKVAVASESVTVNYVVEEDQVDVIMENGEAKVKGEDTPVEAALSLVKASITAVDPEGSATSYATFNGEHLLEDGTKFTTNQVMPNAYLEEDVIQFQAKKGTITIANDGYTKVVLKTMSTYEYDANFLINDEAGDNDAINAAREDTGKKSGDYACYLYTLEVEIAAEAETISIVKNTEKAGAGYVTVIEFYK